MAAGNPRLVIEEYQRRLDAIQAHPRQLELDTLARQLAKARRAIGRLIDSYTEGLIEKPEFEPRLAELRRRLARFEAEASVQQATKSRSVLFNVSSASWTCLPRWCATAWPRRIGPQSATLFVRSSNASRSLAMWSGSYSGSIRVRQRRPRRVNVSHIVQHAVALWRMWWDGTEFRWGEADRARFVDPVRLTSV